MIYFAGIVTIRLAEALPLVVIVVLASIEANFISVTGPVIQASGLDRHYNASLLLPIILT